MLLVISNVVVEVVVVVVRFMGTKCVEIWFCATIVCVVKEVVNTRFPIDEAYEIEKQVVVGFCFFIT